jgi:hypothetical protein
MTDSEVTPKLHIDTDWKAQAQAEKERLLRQEQEKKARSPASGEGAHGREMPVADFRTLTGVLASQAIMGLGAMGDPKSGRIVVDPEGAKFSIDLLGVLEEKTKGNLSHEEASELRSLLAELRARFVQIMQLIAQQAAMPADAGAGSGTGAATEPRRAR